MKKAEVELGRKYTAKVSGAVTVVRLIGHNPLGGWDAMNISTKRYIRIRTAGRLRQKLAE